MQKENQRVMLTKQLLKESLIYLMKKKEIQKVSVSELCHNAGINRVTFYNHYNSLNNLLQEIENELIDNIHDFIKQKNIDQSYQLNKQIEIICDYLNKNRKIARLIFQNNSEDSEFIEKLFYCPNIWDELNKKFSNLYDEEAKNLLLTFIINGTYGMIKKWLLSDINKTPHEISKLINDIYLKNITN